MAALVLGGRRDAGIAVNHGYLLHHKSASKKPNFINAVVDFETDCPELAQSRGESGVPNGIALCPLGAPRLAIHREESVVDGVALSHLQNYGT
jgi:hypothetical protein